jgi:hypothetical protein
VSVSRTGYATSPRSSIRSAFQGARPDLVKPFVPDDDSRFLMKVLAHIYADPRDAALKMMESNMHAEVMAVADCLG